MQFILDNFDPTMNLSSKIVIIKYNLQQLGQVNCLRNLNRTNRSNGTMQTRMILGHDLRLAQLNYLAFHKWNNRTTFVRY